MKTRRMVLVALFAALLCVLAPLAVPAGPVPITLATFVVYLAGGLLGAKGGTAAVALYLLLGLMGLPVFSAYQAGLGVVAGVTGGYLVGYLPCALLTGLFAGRGRWGDAAGMLLGTAVLYAIGTVWFMLQSKNGLAAALSLCVLPFLPGDAVKIALAALLCPRLRPAVSTAPSQKSQTMR